MKKIREIFDLRKAAGQYGIEVEVEGEGLVPMLPGAKCPWRTEHDGSLRGHYPDQCCEYVLDKPIPWGRVKLSLEVLKEQLDKAEKVNFNYRTSVHVHYNVQEFTTVQTMNLIYTYTLLESMLMNFCGEGRVNNRFCLRVRDAEGIIPILQEAFSTNLNSFLRLDENKARYSSLNICAIKKYGSVEFRGMQGTADIERLLTWITAIDNLGTFAKNQESPSSIYNEFVDARTKKDFIKKVLPDVWESFFNEDLIDEVDLSFSLSIDLPFSYAANCKKYIEKPVEIPQPIQIDPLPPGIAEAIRNHIPVAPRRRGVIQDVFVHDDIN